MINFDDVTKENIKEHNTNWPLIPDHPYRILIIGGSGSGKTRKKILIKFICKLRIHMKQNTNCQLTNVKVLD